MLGQLASVPLNQPIDCSQEEDEVTRIELRACCSPQLCSRPPLVAHQECPHVPNACTELRMLWNTNSSHRGRQEAVAKTLSNTTATAEIVNTTAAPNHTTHEPKGRGPN